MTHEPRPLIPTRKHRNKALVPVLVLVLVLVLALLLILVLVLTILLVKDSPAHLEARPC